jgi:hypothetical protein
VSGLQNIYYSDPIIDIIERFGVCHLVDHYDNLHQNQSYGSEIRKKILLRSKWKQCVRGCAFKKNTAVESSSVCANKLTVLILKVLVSPHFGLLLPTTRSVTVPYLLNSSYRPTSHRTIFSAHMTPSHL